MRRLLLLIIFIIGCTKNPITVTEKEFLYSSTYFDYDTNTNELNLYAEIENVTLTNIIDSVWAELYNSDGLLISSVELETAINGIESQNPYAKTEIISDLQYDVYTVKFTMQDGTGNLFAQYADRKDLSPITEAQPAIIDSYSIFEIVNGTNVEIIDNIVTLDEHEWKELNFYLNVSDSNGIGDISHINYKIKGELLGCNEDSDNNGIIDSGIYWEDYVDLGTSGHEWEFEFIDYYSINGNYDAIFIYKGSMLLRPRDGSALFDGNGEIIPNFETKDCGRAGTVFLQFIVTDSSNDPIITEEDIPIEILTP